MEPTSSPLAAGKPRGWPLALLVGFLTGLTGAVLAVPVSDWAMKWHHVSSMEGGRACAALGLWAPLAFIVGAITGVIISLFVRRGGFAGFAFRLGLSLLAVVPLVFTGGGLGYATADHPPLLEGQNLALEIEARIPARGRSIEALNKAGFRIALVVSASDRNYSDLRWSEATAANEFIMVPAWAFLRSRNAGRDIVAGIKDENDQLFTVLLPPSPKKTEEAWSEWLAPRERYDGSKPAPEDQYRVRYRVRLAKEYLPTPRPWKTEEVSSESEQLSEPHESPTPEGSPTP